MCSKCEKVRPDVAAVRLIQSSCWLHSRDCQVLPSSCWQTEPPRLQTDQAIIDLKTSLKIDLHRAANAKNYTRTWLDHVSGCSCCLTNTKGVSPCYLAAKGCSSNTTLSACCQDEAKASRMTLPGHRLHTRSCNRSR